MNHWKAAGLLLLAMLSLCPAAQTQGREVQSGRLLISGSGTMAPLVSEIAKRFQALNPGVSIEVQAGGTRRGLADTRQGKVDIGMVSRSLAYSDRDLQGMPIARDGVALVVHKDNPVRVLDRRQIIGIYTGKLTQWKELGGRDAPILAVAADAGCSASELFSQHFELSHADIRAQRFDGDNAAHLKLLSEHPNAILYMSIGQAEHSAQAGVPVRMLPMGGVIAASKNIRNGNYPISRPLTLVTRGRPAGLARAFIEFSVSSQVTDLVVAHDFVPYLD